MYVLHGLFIYNKYSLCKDRQCPQEVTGSAKINTVRKCFRHYRINVHSQQARVMKLKKIFVHSERRAKKNSHTHSVKLALPARVQ